VHDSIEADRDAKGAVAVLDFRGVCAVPVSCKGLDNALSVEQAEAVGIENGFEGDFFV